MRLLICLASLAVLAGCASTEEGQASQTHRAGQKVDRATRPIGSTLHHLFREEIPSGE